jgi:hypothetical protein
MITKIENNKRTLGWVIYNFNIIAHMFATKDLLIFYDKVDILLDYLYLVASGYNKLQVSGSATGGSSTVLGTYACLYSSSPPPPFFYPKSFRIQYGCICLIGLYISTLNLQSV